MSVVLAYRPKPKSKPAKKWKRRANKIECLPTSRRRRIVSHGNRPPRYCDHVPGVHPVAIGRAILGHLLIEVSARNPAVQGREG
jgi:hypothetical protein